MSFIELIKIIKWFSFQEKSKDYATLLVLAFHHFSFFFFSLHPWLPGSEKRNKLKIWIFMSGEGKSDSGKKNLLFLGIS